MTVFLAHESAWNYWRRTGFKPDTHIQHELAAPMPRNSAGANAIFAAHVPCRDIDTEQVIRFLEINDEQLEVVVPSAQTRKRVRSLSTHVLGCTLPITSFREISAHLYICCPELTFIQMASRKSITFAQLVLYGYELCGSYGRAIRFVGKPELFPRAPLTSKTQLTEYIELVEQANNANNANLSGLKRARRALKYIVDGAASPKESVLTLLLCMPVSQGGYGLPLPTLNECMISGESVYRDTGRHGLVSDLFWIDQKLDVEYDSNERHIEKEQRHKDDTKRNALLDNGFTVFTANCNHIYNPAQTEVLANQIKRALHIRKQSQAYDAAPRRRALREELFAAEDMDLVAPRLELYY